MEPSPQIGDCSLMIFFDSSIGLANGLTYVLTVATLNSLANCSPIWLSCFCGEKYISLWYDIADCFFSMFIGTDWFMVMLILCYYLWFYLFDNLVNSILNKNLLRFVLASEKSVGEKSIRKIPEKYYLYIILFFV